MSNRMNFDSDDDGSSMAVPPSPEQGVGGAEGAPESPMNLNMPSTPVRARGRGINFDSDDSDNDEEQQAMPATPPPLLASAATPSTPLTPLSGLEDNDNDEEDENENAPAQPAPQPQPNDNYNDNIMMEQQEDATTLARGTDVNVHEAATTFTNFLRTFRKLPVARDEDDEDSDEDEEEDQSPPLYIAKLQQLLRHTKPCSLDIDTMHLFFHNPACQRFYHQLVNYPMELVPLMDLVLQREMRALVTENDDDTIPVPSIQVRPYNLQELSNLRCLDPISMDSLVCLKGMIVRCSPIIPDLKVAHFSCVICGHDQQVTIDRGRIQEPHQCSSCNTKDTYQLVHNRSIFADKQLVRLQETPDQVPAGQTPASVVTFCFDDLVDQCQPGDKVEVTGVLRAQPVRVNPKISKLKSIYKTYVDVIQFRTVTGMERHQQQNGQKITQQRIQQLLALSQQPDIYEQLTQSLAPSIWELDNVKKGVLTMLFGGNHQRVQNKDMVANNGDEEEWSEDEDDNNQTNAPANQDTKLHKRGDINILLCGDPGTSKSQLLSYVHKLSARGVYTSGKGSSAVGLTASVIRDPETRDLVLESGALVLSDRGICCIDEFDKMTDATRSILHEAMEQQTVSIAKAGIIASLNARTSILASANPLESRYNPNLSVVDNIKLPPTLLSRFDLIYLILDSPNADQDRRLAQHLVGLYYEIPNVVTPPLDTELLRDYIDYARENIRPSLSDEATEQLLSSYLELRNPPGGNVGNNGMRTISATPRQLESLIRTSEALAKMRYASVVTRADTLEAVRLLKVATQAAATDPRTGRIDMDMINTGRTTVNREMEESLYLGLKELLAERRGKRMAVRDVAKQLQEISNQETVPHDDVVSALKRLEADGMIQFNERAQYLFVRTGIVS